jgi:Ca2+-binding RTX toxin-like protein
MAQYDTVWGGGGVDPADTAPFVMPENVGDAIVIGNDLADEITGNSANNSLEGGDGNDILRGGAGADTLVGSLGQDSYYVDDIGDVIIEDGADGMIDTVHSTISYILGANLETLRLSARAGDIDGTRKRPRQLPLWQRGQEQP